MKHLNRNPLNQALLASLLLTCVSVANASGFYLIEQSGSSQGLSYAGAAANAEDVSNMWFNPALITGIQGSQAILGGHIISPSSEFTNDGSNGPGGNGGLLSGEGDDGATVGFVPNIYWKTEFNSYDFALGVNVPYGQHISYEDDWVGRYHATETDLKTININPVIAKQINDQFSVGFGFNAQYVDVTLEQKINQSAIGDADANAKITGDSLSYGFNLGLLYELDDATNIGLAYRSEISHNVQGSVNYTGVNSSFDLSLLNQQLPAGTTSNRILYNETASADVTIPATLTAAFDHKLNSKMNILGSATWTQWSAYDELVVDFNNLSPDSESNQNFKDSMHYALGMAYQLNSDMKLRTGIALDKTPVPNAESRSPRTPDSDRTWFSLGMGYQVSKTMNIDVAYSHIWGGDADVNYVAESSLGDNTLVGSFDTSVDILSAQVVWKY